jgi:ribosomal protein L11 methyltransferase
VSRQQVSLQVARRDVARVEALLELAGAEAVTLADGADSPLLEPAPGDTPLWPEVAVAALFPEKVDVDALTAVLAAAMPAARIETRPIDDDEWREAAARVVPPRRFGTRLWLVAADSPEAAPQGAVVRLRMGFAFGTGEHPTTALCLEWLDAHPPSGAAVLDYGCGSGVLALAALALGAKQAWAVDNDPQARSAAAVNGALNAAGDRLEVFAPEALPEGLRADLVLANILARPLLERVTHFASWLRPGGHIVLSGVLEGQCDELLEAYVAEFDDLDVASREGWVRIVGRRRAAAR